MKLEDAVKSAKDGAQAVGLLLVEVCKAVPQAREVIEADLDAKSMNLDAAFDALKAHARKHQKNGFWGCPVVGADPDNEVVRVLLDFYKIPAEWIGGAGDAKPQALGGAPRAQAAAAPIDLLDLL